MVRMMIIFCLVLALFLALIPHVLWLVGLGVARICHHSLPYVPFGLSALVLVMIFWMMMAYGFFIGRWRVHTQNIEYRSQEVPDSFDGFRIVHISDLHLSTFDDDPKQLQRFVDSINAQHPDLICFTGDLVSLGAMEVEPYAEVLRQLKASYGILSVLGNHDMHIYSHNLSGEQSRAAAIEQLARYERERLGWKLLRNDHYVIENQKGDSITILGVDNIHGGGQGFQTIDMGDLKTAMRGTSGFRVLLTHDPSHWRAEVVPTTDIPLTLSGHTHAAQIRLFGWTPASLMFREVQGRYDEGGQTLYVNIGLGCTAPFRVGANPEITVITLQHE